ncbi:MAG TPA: 23S rRNA (uracil(1939)-C(5))-methyltransferase RlmD [Acidiferrobacterales bacterium]
MMQSQSPKSATVTTKKGDTAVARVESLNHDGIGVAHVDGKAVFIDGALPGETVRFRYHDKKRRYDTGGVLEVLAASPDRVVPRCPVFGVCGGCSLQHLASAAQLPAKQQVLRDDLERIGKVEPERWLEPLTGPAWGYRRRARLGARLVEKKGGVLVGFREKRKSYITPLQSCEVLHPRVAALLPALRDLIASLSCPNRVPQIEVAVGDGAEEPQAALVFRHLEPFTDADRAALRAFGATHSVQIHLQGGAPDAIEPLWPQPAPPLSYRLPDHDLTLRFQPTDFIQVNGEINRRLVNRALELLAPAPEDRVLDLFCGIGNFTLPLARRAGRVLGLEADAGLVARAWDNARLNGIGNVEFGAADLYAEEGAAPWGGERFTLWLLDPPRTGAMEAVKHLPDDGGGPRRILYVSCNPATLARDSELLVHVKGYRLEAAGALDMFPQTSHVEALALFVRDARA